MTVAGWPAFTLPISDSLSGTTSCIELRSLRIAKEELEELEESEDLDELLDAPAPAPAAEAPPAAAVPVPVPDPPEEELLDEALVVPPPETVSPT